MLAGKYGKKATMKPFDGLTVSQLAQELEARDVSKTGLLKPEMAAKLQGILRGFLRVPSLLMYNPTQSLQDYNLHKYTVLDCEPLHDLKGHLHNIFIEVEAHLQSEVASACKDILNQVLKKEKAKGSDYRHAAVLLLLCLLQQKQDNSISTILQTVVEISEIMYSTDDKRSCKSILRLYNLTWIHAEKCVEVFHTPRKMSREKFFGTFILLSATLPHSMNLSLSELSMQRVRRECLATQTKSLAIPPTDIQTMLFQIYY